MSTGKELATYNEKALSLKQYLSNDSIKRQIMDAAPKMLNGERFLKVFYGAILRNPKLLECTTESMLQAAMFFSQLGLEPILGRAYLVPYLNSKNIDGRWQKQYEVQAQVGYQGLVDLARRSSTISDVWGASVYENDEFDLSYGMERNLTHRPWFMDPAKRKSEAGPGDFLGAYCVWQLKDGTKHPEFMPASEIHKRRAKSQSYTWAETGDTNKGGGKRDSVWHQWPEEMALKTVIKHSSKLVPASIEFLEAVQMDDDRDNGFRPAGFLTEFTTPSESQAPDFNTVFADIVSDPAFELYFKTACETYKLSPDEARAEFVKQPEQIKRLFAEWKKQSAQPKTKAPEKQETKPEDAKKETEQETTPPPADDFRSKWINLKEAGFSTFVFKNIDKFKALQGEALAEAVAKWKKIYPSFSIPFVARVAEPDQQPAAEPQNEAETVSAGGSPPDFESTELARLKAEIAMHERAHRDTVKQAMEDAGIAHPTTIDGCRVVLEAIAARMKG